MKKSNWITFSGLPISIPTGGIIMYNGASAPEDYAIYSAADDHYIVGAGGTLAPLDSDTPVGNVSLATGGSHYGPDTRYYWNDRPATSKYHNIPTNAGKGAHAHTGTVEVNPNSNNTYLIQAQTEAGIPQNGSVFSDDTVKKMELNTDFNGSGGIMRASASYGFETRGHITSVVSSSMSHNHVAANNTDGYSYVVGNYGYSVQSHPHDHTFPLTGAVKQVVLKAFKAVQDVSKVDGSVIIMWTSNSLPQDWTLCDGSNGTPDCRDAFINTDTTGVGSVSGNNSWSASGQSSTFGHGHGTSDTRYVAAVQTRHPGLDVHDHSVSWADTLLPKHFALNFIKYTG